MNGLNTIVSKLKTEAKDWMWDERSATMLLGLKKISLLDLWLMEARRRRKATRYRE